MTIANIGEEVVFVRKSIEVTGKVEKHLENSVIVQISNSDAKELGYESQLTVVSHKNYQIVN